MRELAQSRICFSPYGYGEVCWRDYEAIMCGALLVKPDMAHVQTDPDIFVPYETYVPVAWDFSDLAEKMNYYLANDVARTKIVNRAYSTLYEYLQRDAFIDQFAVLFKQF
jgi:spore maturation protein CgeB